MRSEARIIDANANRASEGLRTLEDIARFALDDKALCERTKRARHQLTDSLGLLPLPAGLRVSVRDTPGDVGTAVTTESEGVRTDLAGVAAAAASRVAQAVRAIEETAKALGATDPAFEALRYEVYEIDRLVRTGLVPVSPQWRLCVLLTAALCPEGDWERVAHASIEGGVDCIQLREKSLPDRDLLVRARRLRAITASASVALVINDRPDIALLCGADAVHVGQGDLSPRDVRAVAGAGMPVGVSTSSLAEAHKAVRSGASSVGLGPMFATTTKEKDRIAGPGFVTEVMRDESLRGLPHLCIGGISTANARTVADAGARGLAVSSAVCGSGDPARTCRELLAIAAGADS